MRANGKPQCRGCKVVAFFQNVLYPNIGLRLLPWQKKELHSMYGTVRPENGLRQYTSALLEVPKQNGKTFILGGLPIYHMMMENIETHPEVYGAATARDQAGLIFKASAQLVAANSDLKSRLRVLESTKKIIRRDGGGSYTVLSADGAVNDGIRPSLALIDELHRWKTDRAHALMKVMSAGMISRIEGLKIQITTFGSDDESPMWLDQHDMALQKEKGELSAERFYYSSYHADAKRVETEPEYWKSREARSTANPSHEDNGGFLKDEKIVEELNVALANPVKKSEYLRFHLNVKTSSTVENAIDMPAWRACGGSEVDLREWPALGPDELRLLCMKWGLLDRPCWVGMDLSWTVDMTGLVFVFPPIDDEETWTLLPFAFVAKGQLSKLTRKTVQPQIPHWAKAGFISETDGNAVDTAAIKERIKWGAELFELREVAFDPWNARNIATDLTDLGLNCVEVRQGYGSLSEATKKLLQLCESGNLRHGNHPVFNWHASCLALQGDRKDNVQPAKPERQTSKKRIDLIAATVTAMSRALVCESAGSARMLLL